MNLFDKKEKSSLKIETLSRKLEKWKNTYHCHSWRGLKHWRWNYVACFVFGEYTLPEKKSRSEELS